MELLRRNGVPTAIPEKIPTRALISAINHDNKRGYLPETRGTSLMVLLERLGRPHRSQGTVLTQVPIETLYAGIEALRP
jgi:3-dehydroquinate synthase/2-deoxy-scyllo-inosose synthase